MARLQTRSKRRPRRRATAHAAHQSVFAPVGPPQGRVVRFELRDAQRQYLADGLTPSRAVSLLKAADDGDIGSALELWSEIRDRDPRLYSLLRKRMMALTGLEYEIVSAYEISPTGRMDKELADAAAAFISDELVDVHGFDRALRNLAHALAEGVSVAELLWGGNRLRAIADVPSSRLRYDYNVDAAEGVGQRLRIRTKDNETPGVAAAWSKFVIHAPTARSGFPQRGALLRVLTLNYLIRSYAVKDWATFIEVFGMPIRTATYGKGATAEEKQEMLNMLRLIGSDAVAIFSEAMHLNMIESTQRGTAPFEAFLKWLDEQATIAVLGQTLTTQMSESGGSFAAAQVHKGVEEALGDDDRRSEASTVRDQILAPMIRFSFGRPEAPVPFFRRKLAESVDTIREAQKFSIALGFGLPIAEQHVYDTLDIPAPANAQPDALITRPAAPAFPGFGSGAGAAFTEGV